eukprot:5222722-Pyramimonas_sp.AAC.2
MFRHHLQPQPPTSPSAPAGGSLQIPLMIRVTSTRGKNQTPTSSFRSSVLVHATRGCWERRPVRTLSEGVHSLPPCGAVCTVTHLLELGSRERFAQ